MTDITSWLREQAANDFTCEAKLIEAAETIERMENDIKVQSNAVKMLDGAWAKEINYHRKKAQEYDISINTLDGEREVNAILTEEIDRLKAITWAQAGEIDRLAADNHRLVKQIQILQGRLYLNKLPHDVLEGTEE